MKQPLPITVKRSGRSMKIFLGLALLASVASAGTITQFNAVSTSTGFWMNVTGTDNSGNQINVTYAPDDIGAYPDCGCVGGTPISIFGGIGGIGYATVDGVGYGGSTLIGQNEAGYISMSGQFPEISLPLGAEATVTFPVSLFLDLTFYQNGSGFSVNKLFDLYGYIAGTATAKVTTLESDNGVIYEASSFTYTSAVPEPSTAWLSGLGFLALLAGRVGYNRLARARRFFVAGIDAV